MLKKFFQDNTGKYVIGQPPNFALILIACGALGSALFKSGRISVFSELLFFGSAFLWGYLELRYGESIFRRVLGAIVLIVIFTSRLR